MAGKPKLETVAKRAGVSVATVSQVMRGAGRISDSTRKKVLQTAKDMNYVPDGRAASMRSGQNREIGLAIHQIANPFNAEVISGASDLLETEGYLLSVLDARDDAARQRPQLEAFIGSSRAGLIWVPAEATPATTFELLKTHKLPTITFLRNSGSTEFDHLGIQNAQATECATAHLADLGHSKIAFLGGVAQVGVRNERIEGYRRCLSARNLGPPIVWDSPDDKLSGVKAMSRLLDAHPEVTAVVCNGDMVAIGASLALTQRGLTPGHDVSIVGFDDIQDAEIAIPPLTTMAVSPYELGRKLARLVINRINEPDTPVATTLFPARLIVRNTTGAPPKTT